MTKNTNYFSKLINRCNNSDSKKQLDILLELFLVYNNYAILACNVDANDDIAIASNGIFNTFDNIVEFFAYEPSLFEGKYHPVLLEALAARNTDENDKMIDCCYKFHDLLIG